MVTEWLELAGYVLAYGLVGFECIAFIVGVREAVCVTQEGWPHGPLTFFTRLRVFALEWLWLSFFFSDALKRAFKVPNYPIRTGMLSFGSMVGYCMWQATGGNLFASLGGGILCGLAFRVGAQVALRRSEAYQKSLEIQAQYAHSS